MKRITITLLLTVIFALAAPVYAASPATAVSTVNSYDGRTLHEETLKSDLMKRTMPYRIYLPEGYAMKENMERQYPVIYLLHGLTGSYKNWADLTRLKGFGYESDFIIVMPEGANGWYTDSTTDTTEEFESYIIKELIPDVETKYRAKTDRKGRVIAGLSMGGYGALKFGLKYPEMFVLAGSFSGALRAAEWDPATLKGVPAAETSIRSVFGAMDNPVRETNDIFKIVKGLDQEKLKKLPFLYLDCGTEDFLFKNNQDFAQLLVDKKARHEYRQRPGGHDWIFWNAQVEQFLTLSAKFTGVE